MLFVWTLPCVVMHVSRLQTTIDKKKKKKNHGKQTHWPGVAPWGRALQWCRAVTVWAGRQWWAGRRQTWIEASLYKSSSCSLPGSVQCGWSRSRMQRLIIRSFLRLCPLRYHDFGGVLFIPARLHDLAVPFTSFCIEDQIATKARKHSPRVWTE